MDKILTYLKQLDLSDIEAKLYLTLLKTGPISVRALAATVAIKRTTAYLYIDQLVEKGLIVKLVKGSQKQVAANEPEEYLQHLVEKKLEEANEIKKQLPEILSTITSSLPQLKDVGEADIKYYKGIKSVERVYQEALNGKELCLYATLSELLPIFLKDPNLFENALKRNKELKIFEIYGDAPNVINKYDYTAKNNRYLYKFMPSDVGLTAPGILLYDNKVAIVNIKGKTAGCFVLHNKDYYVNSRKLFDFIWKMLPELHA